MNRLLIVLIFFLVSICASATSPNILKWQKHESDLPVVMMKINGHEVRAFFDSGAKSISVGEITAKKLGLFTEEPKEKSTGTFAGGKTSETFKVNPVTLTIGTHEFKDFPIRVVKGADELSWRDVTVGVELLRRTRILMDYKAKTMEVLDNTRLSKNKKVVELPVEFVGNTHIMIIQSKINGNEAFLHFDTGGTFALNIFSTTAKNLGMETEKKLDGGKGNGGQDVSQIFYKNPVQVCLKEICEMIKPIAIEGQDAMWTPIIKLFGKEIIGQLSHDFFTGKKVEYDILQNKIWVLAK